MIVDDFNVFSAIAPAEANAPLSVYANAVLPFAVSLKSFQPIAWGYTQVIKPLCGGKHFEFTPGNTLKSFRCSDRRPVK